MGAWEEYERRNKEYKERKEAGKSSSSGAWAEYERRNKELGYGYDVTDEFINTFVEDTNKFFSGYGEGKEVPSFNIATSTLKDLESRRNAVQLWLKKNKEHLGEESYNNLTKSLGEMTNGFDEIKSYYSKFENEEQFKSAIQYAKDREAKENADLEALKKEINDLVKQGASADEIAEKRAFYNEAEYIQKGIELSSVANSATDYDTYSKYVEPEKPKGVSLGVDKESINKKYGGDANLVYINDESQRDSIEMDYSMAYGVGSKLYRDATEHFDVYEKMTEDEVAIYNYYYNKDGKDKADEYFYSIQQDLENRVANEYFDAVEGKAFLEMLFGVKVGLDQFFTGWDETVETIFGQDDDGNYIVQGAVQTAGGMAREDLEDVGFKVFGNSLGQMGFDAFSTTANMLPSIIVSTVASRLHPMVGRVAGSVLLGASAAGNAKLEMQRLGYTKEQANSYGLLVGASEAGLEFLLGGIGAFSGGGGVFSKIGSKVLGKVDNAFARVAIQLGSSMADEALEEGLQTILEPWFKSLVTGVDFEAPEIDEVLYSSLLGAITAGLFEGGSTITGEVNTYKQGQSLIKNGLSVEKLTNFAKDRDYFSADSVAYRLAGKVNEKTGAYTIGRLFNEMNAQLTERNQSDIARALESYGIRSKDAKTLATALAQVVAGAELTQAQKEMLENNPILAKVFKEVIIDENSTVNQRMMGLREAFKTDSSKTSQEATGQAKEVSPTENTSVVETTENKAENVSEDGKTYYTNEDGNSEEVSINKIASTKNGLSVELDNGSIVKASDISFGTEAESLMYNMISRIDVSPEIANEILSSFKPTDTKQAMNYFHSIPLAYNYGKIGYEQGLKNVHLSKEEAYRVYNQGRKYAEEQATAKTKTSTKASKTESTYDEDKGITYENGFKYDESKATKIQKVSMGFIEAIAKMSNLDVHVFESVIKDGKRVAFIDGKWQPAPNGFFRNGNEIYIDINAGNKGEGAMLYTMAHEITHYIRRWNAQGFKELADFLFKHYGHNGVSVDYLLKKQTDKIKARYEREGKALPSEAKLHDMAYEELVADAMSEMLADPKAYEKLIQLKSQNRTLWQKIGEAIKNILDKLKKALNIYKKSDISTTREAFHVRDFSTDVYNKLQDLYIKAFSEADANYAMAEKTLSENGIAVDSEAEFGTIMSVRDVLDDTQRDKVAQALSTRFGVTQQEALSWLDAETSLASLILNPKYSEYLDYTPDPNEVAIKQNSDYPQGTVDFSPICAKRREFTSVMNGILRQFPNHVFAATDLAKIRTIMQEEGMTIPCGICYVEDRRQLDTIVAQNFIDSLKLYREGSKTRPDGKAFNTNQLKGLKLIDGDSYTPSVYELVSLEGLNVLKEKNPNMAEAWVKFNNARGMQSVRLLANEAEYKRQILKYNKQTVKSKNDKGGLRVYSFSDAEMFHLIDIIQVITDSATVGLSLQGYTKVNEYAKTVKDTGEKLNRSLIPKGKLGYHIENGKVVLDYDTVEGIDINHPDFFDNKDNPNVGNITIGINDVQIRAAMLSDFVDQIIPFHTGQSEEVLNEKGISTWDNYKDFQTEKDIATGKVSEHQINIYTEVLQALENEGKPITKRTFVEKFLQVCKENGLTPRFSQFLNTNEQGEYVYTEGYHKMLVDFKTFAQTEVGEYLPQKPVKPIFDNEYTTKILKDYVKSQKVKDAEIAKSMPKVIERITNEIINPNSTKFSDRDSLGNELSKEQQEFFKDSKVRDADGNLMVVYHGTFEKFSVFDISKTSDINKLGRGHYFTSSLEDVEKHYIQGSNNRNEWNDTDNKIEAMAYELFEERGYSYEDSLTSDPEIIDILNECYDEAEKYYSKENATVISAYLNVTNPLYVKHGQEVGSINDKVFVDKDNNIVEINESQIAKSKYDGIIDTTVSKTFGGVSDGTVHIVVFNSNQIKSTTNKKPTSDPDIRYSYRDSGENSFNPEGKTLREQLEDAYSTSESFDQRYVYVGRFSNELRELLKDNDIILHDYPIAMNYRDAYLSMHSKETGKYKGDNINYHNLGVNGLEAALESFKSPLNIMKSKREGKIELVLQGVDKKGNPLLSIVAINTVTQNGRKYLNAHIVTSVYGRRSIDSYIRKAEMEGRLIKAKKEETSQGIPQVQYKGNINEISSDNRISQNPDSVNTKFSDRDIQPITDTEYETLKKHFGTTANFKVAGYLLTDGKLLDFSGKHWGDNHSRSRQVDHRDVQEVLGRGNNGINDMVDMIGSGNIRLMPETGGINLAVYPNEKQRRVLSVYINYMLATEGQVIVDYDTIGGDTVYSRVYEKGATSKQILSDIRNYFNGGRQSDLMKFHTQYSDRDSYAPTFYSYMGKVVDGIKIEKMGAGGVVSYLKGKGVKNEEIKWSGIETWLEGKKSVTKAELQEFIRGSQLQIVEQMSSPDDWELVKDGNNWVVKGLYGEIRETWEYTVNPEDPDLVGWMSDISGDIVTTIDEIQEILFDEYGSGTRWREYKLDGGTNYRELVFQMPNSSYSNRAMRVHWGQDAEGVLVHTRVQDFDIDGKKMLFIEEIQSDWHNEGHSKGYSTKEYEDAVESHDKLYNEYKKLDLAFHKYVRSNEFMTDPEDVRKKKHDWLRGKVDFAQKKYLDADKVVNSLKEKGAGDTPDAPFKDTYHEYVLKRLLRMATEEGYDSIGWTPAKIQEERWSDEFAEGYRIEYDQDIPSFLKKYGKKWGATVGKTTVNDIEVWSMGITDSMKESVLYEGQTMYSDRVTDQKTLDFLENQEHITTYKSFVEIDGKLYSPMATQVKGKDGKYRLTNPSEIGVWQQAEEKPENIKKFHKTNGYGYFDLKKDNGKTVLAAYNPYEHSSNLVLNDQFEEAYQRPNLVTVECVIPKSEMTSGYKAKYAKDSTGYLDWKSGTVAGKMKGNKRKVYLSRWLKPVRILSDAEVASMYKEMLGTSISVPFNVVSPSLLTELEKVGVKVDYEGSPMYKSIQKRKATDDTTKFSDRDNDSVSNRSLLANALESVAQNEIEKNKLKQYKDKIALIESEQKKLGEIKSQANDLRFTKGRTPAETKRMKDLDAEATQIANRISTYDKQLLNLESTSALKNVLEREKVMLRKRLEQKGKEALKRQKEKDAKTVRELMTRYQESRAKGVEGRHKTEMKNKIKKVVSDLNKLLLNPTKEQHVPIGLQRVVAEALDAINMDTMNAEERVAYYNDLISKSSDPDEIAMLTKKRDFFEYRDMNFKDRITALKNAYAEFKESDDPLIRNAHNDAIEDLIKNTADEVGNKSLKDMSYEQLETVYNMYKAILATVRNSNKMFKEGIQATVTENSEAVKVQVKEVGGHKDRVNKLLKPIKQFGWNMLKPVTAMKVIGSKTFEKLFDNVRAGEDTWAVDVNEARDFYQDKAKNYNFKKWDFKKRHSFKDSRGNDFSLSLEQIMSLYAYSKRKQADKHLELGGFIFDDAIEVTEKKLGIPVKYEVNDANPYRINLEIMGEIASTLTEEQRNFVDEMQAYLSDVMGEKGNEVSLAMYDIKLYNEKYYFPLKSSRYFREFDSEQSATPKIKNSGFSKKTVPQAGNPIVLSNFMDVWASHVNEMSMYHAFVLPLEDFMRVYNYSSTAGGYDSVQQYIKNAYGSQANQYIEKLLVDLNGGARVDSTAGFINKGLSLFKKASVFASASVVIQQPSAIARAFAYINPMYFVTSAPSAINLVKHKKVWEEVKKYAPVAVIKEMGYFDTGMGRSTVDWIKGNQTIKDKVDDALSKAPAMADELSWAYIWEAVKRETKAKTNLTVGSEEFLKKAGERFTEIIINTQVYDSVLSRSGMMRSKDTGMKMATAFMAEPTTVVNMMVDGIVQGIRGNKKFLASTVGAVSASIILNSILVSLVNAARDDDEDETYAEKYIGSLTTELIDGFNPLTYIPFVKDIWSIAQGYDVERSDMSVISDLWATVEGLFNEDKKGWEKVADVAGAVSSMFGIPLKNIIRDAKAVYNLAETVTSGTPTTSAGIGDSVEDSLKNSVPLWGRFNESETKSDKLYDAIISGDQNQIDRIKGQFKDEKAIESAMKQGLRENDPRIKEAAQARLDGDISEYTRIAKEIIAEGHFSQDTVVGAINAELTKLKNAQPSETETTEEEEEKDEVTSIYKASDINSAFENGDNATALEIIQDLIDTKVANGMEEKEAKSSLRSSMTSYWKPLYKQAYQSGNTSEMQRIRQILFASGLYGNGNEVVKTVQNWLRD